MEDVELSHLIEILNQEVELLERLHGVLVSQQEALVAGDVEGITTSIEQQIDILNRIGTIEERRKQLVEAYASIDEDSSIKIDQMIEIAPDYLASRLKRIRSSLKEVIEAIGKVNAQNGMLINQSLAYIDNTIKMIAGEDDSSKVYTPNGELTCSTGQIAINRTI